MTRYIIRRVLWGILLLILVTALMFVLFRILPTGDPARLRAGRNASPKMIADLRVDLGLNKSLPAQFWIYMKESSCTSTSATATTQTRPCAA